MIKVSMHNHSSNSFDSEAPMVEMVKSAITNKFKYFGFSEHQDFDSSLDEYLYLKYDNYSEEFNKVKTQFLDGITLLKSIEIDYQTRYEGTIKEYLTDKDFDYIVGSVHYLDGKSVDLPEFEEQFETLGSHAIVKGYLAEILNLVKSGIPNIVGHLDLVKLYTVDVAVMRYEDALIEIFDVMKEKNIILEINYAGLRKNIKSAYPSNEILELYYNNGNRLITISADAHMPLHLEFDPDLSFIKEIGFDAVYVPCKGELIELDI